MILVIVDGAGHRVLRITLAVPVIVNYQVAGEPHQPIRKIALFGIVLIERLINTYKNILCKVLGGIDARCEPVRQVKDASRKCRDNIFPRRAVARSGPPDEFRTIKFGHSLYSFQKSFSSDNFMPESYEQTKRSYLFALSMIGYEGQKTKVPNKAYQMNY